LIVLEYFIAFLGRPFLTVFLAISYLLGILEGGLFPAYFSPSTGKILRKSISNITHYTSFSNIFKYTKKHKKTPNLSRKIAVKGL